MLYIAYIGNKTRGAEDKRGVPPSSQAGPKRLVVFNLATDSSHYSYTVYVMRFSHKTLRCVRDVRDVRNVRYGCLT